MKQQQFEFDADWVMRNYLLQDRPYSLKELAQKYLVVHGYERGFWRDAEGTVHEIPKMETSHIQNCVAFLERRLQEPELKRSTRARWGKKIGEFMHELKVRELKGEQVMTQTTVVRITEQDLVDLVKTKGVKIPATGARAYWNKQHYQTGLTVEFTTQKTLSPGALGNGSSRQTSKTRRRASKRRS